jgi:GT2 family glycosyltransferase
MTICEECNEPFKLRNSKGSVWRRLCACGDLADFEPAHRATIIVPSRFPDIFEDCRDSINKFAPKENKILVRDGNSIAAPEGWQTIQGPDAKFVYSRNINLGIAASTGDVLLTNDDVRFMHPNTLEIMQNVMARNPEVGILSPLIKGDVGEYWQSHATKTLHYTDVRLCFVCVLIRREALDKVGLLDERFSGYGYDDCDYSRRVVNAGYKLGVTARAVVTHGHGTDHRSASYNRQELGTIDALDKIAQEQYKAKWGDLSLECK